MVGRCRGLGDAQALPRFLNEAKLVHECAEALPSEIDEVDEQQLVELRLLAARAKSATAENHLLRGATNDVFGEIETCIDAAVEAVKQRKARPSLLEHANPQLERVHQRALSLSDQIDEKQLKDFRWLLIPLWILQRARSRWRRL